MVNVLLFKQKKKKVRQPNKVVIKPPNEKEEVKFIRVTCGDRYTVAIDSEQGQGWGWGLCDTGQLGLGRQLDAVCTPEKIHAPEGTKCKLLGLGGTHSLGVFV